MAFEDIASPSVLVSSRRYEVQRTNNFEFIVSGIYGSRDLSLAVESAPNITIGTEPTELHLGNRAVKVATSKATFEGGDLVLKDFIEADTEDIVLRWHRQVYNPDNDQIGYAYDYKRTAYIIEYSPNGDLSRRWVLEGCWPSNVAMGELSYENGEKKQVTVTLQYDKAYRDMG